MNYAKENNRILLTHNCRDVEDLHRENPNHQGILAIYRGADSSKNMSRKTIVRAIANTSDQSATLWALLEKSGADSIKESG